MPGSASTLQNPVSSSIAQPYGDVAVVLDRDRVVEAPGVGSPARCGPTAAICGWVKTADGTNRWSLRRGASGCSRLCATTFASWLATCLSWYREQTSPSANTPSAGVRWKLVDDDPPVRRAWGSRRPREVEPVAVGRSGPSPRAAGRPRTTAPSARSSAIAAGVAAHADRPSVPSRTSQRRRASAVNRSETSRPASRSSRLAARDHRHRAAERGEDVRELRRDVASRRGSPGAGQRVHPHHRVGGVERRPRSSPPRSRGTPGRLPAAITIRSAVTRDVGAVDVHRASAVR